MRHRFQQRVVHFVGPVWRSVRVSPDRYQVCRAFCLATMEATFVDIYVLIAFDAALSILSFSNKKIGIMNSLRRPN
jgi:hypothetical protein